VLASSLRLIRINERVRKLLLALADGLGTNGYKNLEIDGYV
jgi:hypothetical protein